MTIENFNNILLVSAAESIPKSSGIRHKPSVPWWNKDIKNAIIAKNTALRIFKRNPSLDNLINFKRLRAASRRIIRESKRKSWENYVSTLSRDTPTTDFWK